MVLITYWRKYKDKGCTPSICNHHIPSLTNTLRCDEEISKSVIYRQKTIRSKSYHLMIDIISAGHYPSTFICTADQSHEEQQEAGSCCSRACTVGPCGSSESERILNILSAVHTSTRLHALLQAVQQLLGLGNRILVLPIYIRIHHSILLDVGLDTAGRLVTTFTSRFTMIYSQLSILWHVRMGHTSLCHEGAH